MEHCKIKILDDKFERIVPDKGYKIKCKLNGDSYRNVVCRIEDEELYEIVEAE